jgi:hypothetical protein
MNQATRNIAQVGWDEVPDYGSGASQSALDGASMDTPKFRIRQGNPDTVPGDPSTTFVLPIGGTLNGSHGYRDSDWYIVNLVAGVGYIIDLSGNRDLILSLHDANGSLLVENRNYVGDFPWQRTITWTASTSGRYYVESEVRPGAVGSYSLSIRL